MAIKNKSIKALLTLLFFVISSTAQAVLPVIDPTGHDLAKALGGKAPDYRVIHADGCLVQYKKFIHTENSKILGSRIEKIDLKKALDKKPFCEKIRILALAISKANREVDKEENND